jgi:hypothetical protein
MMATKLEILEILQNLGTVYDRKPGNVNAYYWVLNEYDVDTLERAAKWHVKNSKWFPKPSELVTACERERGAGYEHRPHMDALLNYYNYTPEELETYARACDNEGAVSTATAIRKRAQFVTDGYQGGPQPRLQDRDLS